MTFRRPSPPTSAASVSRDPFLRCESRRAFYLQAESPREPSHRPPDASVSSERQSPATSVPTKPTAAPLTSACPIVTRHAHQGAIRAVSQHCDQGQRPLGCRLRQQPVAGVVGVRGGPTGVGHRGPGAVRVHDVGDGWLAEARVRDMARRRLWRPCRDERAAGCGASPCPEHSPSLSTKERWPTEETKRSVDFPGMGVRRSAAPQARTPHRASPSIGGEQRRVVGTLRGRPATP